MHETLNRSALSRLGTGSHVNLERAMPANGRFGGHIMAGHVDGVGTVANVRRGGTAAALRRDDTAVWFTVRAAPDILRYIVEKGSVAIDGISLTVAAVTQTDFSISAIPHTVANTVLRERKRGDPVNLETDVIGKYVEKLLCPTMGRRQDTTITKEFLSQHGF